MTGPIPDDAPDRSVLAGPPVEVARALLGAALSTHLDDGAVTVRITEVEAYGGAQDPGSHAFGGPTRRNASMFGPPGHLYVYRHLGLHHCANVVTGPPGTGAAVLLRAGEVVEGVELAWRRRAAAGVVRTTTELARGPARLVVALGLGPDLADADLLDPAGPVRLRLGAPAADCRSGPRVGVSGAGGRAELFAWRLWLPGEPSVSDYRAARPPASRTARPRRTDAPSATSGTAD
ncbi:MAG TPA: DNA-3-methyladenine glycosylase [Actinotalea sp.]|nr:DNA-3-methyladenine glycosylase [Actinotalea sp.]